MTEKTKKEPEHPNKLKVKTTESSIKKQSFRLASISLVIALAALLAVIFSFNEAQRRDKSINEELSITNKTIGELVDKQQQFKQAISQVDQIAKKQMETFELKLDAYKQSMQEISRISSTVNTGWQLKKAQFYLQLAQINAHWSQQPQTTIDLLKQADALLADQHHPDIYDVRQQIARDISTIKKQSKLDIVGIITQINTIQTQLQKLTYRDDPLLSKKSADIQKQKKARENWRQNLAASVNALEKLVVIRHHKQPIKPILSDQQFGLIKEALYVDMQQAKWSVIHRNQAIFNLTIEQAIKEIKRHFNPQQTLVANILSELNSLQKIQLKHKTLEPSKALMMLNKYLKSSDGAMKMLPSTGGKH